MSARRSNEKEKIEQCFYCVHNRDPDYKDWRILKNFMTARGKIISRQRSGLCARHQRRLSKAIKRAREVALL